MTPRKLPRSLIPILTLLVVFQGIGPMTVLAAVPDTCESHGVRYDCSIDQIITERRQAEWDVGLPGATNLTTTNLSIEEWPEQLADGRPILPGVSILGRYERLTHLNETLSANASNAVKPRYVDTNGLKRWPGGAVHVLQYSIRLEHDIAMNGVSKIYFRSPLQWDNATYRQHFLEVTILNEDGTEKALLAAARYNPEGTANTDTLDSVRLDDRLYYELDGLFPANVTFTVNEYVETRTVGGTPVVVQGVNAYMTEGQDVGSDELASFRLFPGHGDKERHFVQDVSFGRTVQFQDLGWSARLAIGMGAGGTVGLIINKDDASSVHMKVPFVYSEPLTDATGTPIANRVQITVPLKLSQPVDVTLDVTPFCTWATRFAASEGQVGYWQAGTTRTKTVTQVTGTISEEMYLSSDTTWCGTATGHWYDITVRMALPATSDCFEDGIEECAVVSYPMSEFALPNGAHAHHIVDSQGIDAQGLGWANARGVYAQPWVQVVELYDPDGVPTDSSASPHAGTILLGAGSILLGFGIIAGATGLLLASCTAAAIVSLGVSCVAAASVTIVVAIPLATGAFVYGAVAIREGAAGAPPSAVFTKELLDAVARGVGKVMAIGACAGLIATTLFPAKTSLRSTYIARGALGVGCAAGMVLASGGIDGFLDFVYDVVKIITKAIEVGGKLLAQLADYAVTFLENAEPWVKVAYVVFASLTVLWAVREGVLWILNMLWPFVSSMPPRAKAHAQRFEDIVENISVPFWDAVMYRYGAIRGRYRRIRRNGNPD